MDGIYAMERIARNSAADRNAAPGAPPAIAGRATRSLSRVDLRSVRETRVSSVRVVTRSRVQEALAE